MSFARLCPSYIVEEFINGSFESIYDRIDIVDFVLIYGEEKPEVFHLPLSDVH